MLIKNCKLIDREGLVDILIEDGKIARIEAGIEYDGEMLDAQGKDVLPGMIDVHTHMREPGMIRLTTDRFRVTPTSAHHITVSAPT